MKKITHAFFESPCGRIVVFASGDALIGAYFYGQKHFRMPEDSVPAQDNPALDAARGWFEAYFAGENPADHLPLAPQGSIFQSLVWRLLREIPYGVCVSYKTLAARAAAVMGRSSMACQAVGQAVGRNPLSVLIPCHRVIGANGKLTGYAAGIGVKRKLLEIEDAWKPAAA